jgi:predicted nucleic acid-binding Zn ribbon protein
MPDTTVETKIAVHEAICSERYKNIEEKLDAGDRRMWKIELQLYIVIAAILFGPGVAADIVKKLLGL